MSAEVIKAVQSRRTGAFVVLNDNNRKGLLAKQEMIPVNITRDPDTGAYVLAGEQPGPAVIEDAPQVAVAPAADVAPEPVADVEPEPTPEPEKVESKSVRKRKASQRRLSAGRSDSY